MHWKLEIGESYMDVTLRLEQIVLDIERTREPILIVGKFTTEAFPRVKNDIISYEIQILYSPSRHPPIALCIFHGVAS